MKKRNDEAIGRGEKVGSESGKQDDKVGRREMPADTKGGVRHSENYDWEGIGDIVEGYEDTEEVEKKKMRGIFIIILYVHWRICR